MALRGIRATYKGEFRITPEQALYLRVEKRAAEVEDRDGKLKDMFRAFFLADGKRRSTCTLTYLNYFDEKGRFQYQLYYDPQRNVVVQQARSPYY